MSIFHERVSFARQIPTNDNLEKNMIVVNIYKILKDKLLGEINKRTTLAE